ncbi:tetratricopeptide repeat protein 5-like [Cylas formicarius]|uniref:tetratricopeptide repeat protein 5-like n=1 Tax=Cylas formicarius TaxID=197179 RepID=UPI0029583658|nr:tetratricopeptide repeat protein 5-like [Cylas formicarius]XP_060530929.1 tetratricopeptide repeat protein 5-like [Cylas formicarius]XP_060530930.1 tetratricopeptide repeat protein 5-like [Cylas formicarius]
MDFPFESQCSGCDINHDDILEFLGEVVSHIYAFRDRYFENHGIDEALKKNEEIKQVLDKDKHIFQKHEQLALKLNKAKYNFLKGKLLNVLPDYSQEAEILLSKAIKLDPKLVDAWNELGECYCKNNDLIKATSCFEGALKEKKNKISLRSLSILSRQAECKNNEEKVQNIEKGLSYAKESVQLDPKDGLSWAILGNAHLSYFFGIQQNPRILKQCLGAYSQAEKDIVAKSTSDLHYNKGITLKYEEEFQLALECFNEASLYDPTWEPPKTKEKQLLRYLAEIQELVIMKGKMKPKKLQQILQSIDNKKLGPYGGGSYTSSSGQTVKLIETPFNRLISGLNEEKVVLGKVVCSVRNEDSVPFTFCMVDKNGECIVVSVFNLADGKGVIIGDSVAIPEPFITDIDFSYRENTFKFRLVRVETPVILVVNGKKIGKELQAGVQMSISKKFD